MAKREDKPRTATEIEILLKIHEALQMELTNNNRVGLDSLNKPRSVREKLKAEFEKLSDEEKQNKINIIPSRNSWQDIADYLRKASKAEGIRYPEGRSSIYHYLNFFEKDLEVPFELANPADEYKDYSEEQKKKIRRIYKYPKGFRNEALFDYVGERLMCGSNELRSYLAAIEDETSLGVWVNIFVKNLTRRRQLTKAVVFYDKLDLVPDDRKKFEIILKAILDKQPLEIHSKYDKRGQVKIQPYLLKNYNQRWYLIGDRWNEEPRPTHPDEYYEGYANIALNAIEDLKSEDGKILIPAIQPWNVEYKEPKEDLDLYFDEIVGVTASKEGPQEVYLRFSKDRYEKYVATKPILPFQKGIVKDSNSEYYDAERPTLHIRAHITKELVQQILSFGPDCEVIAPASLREEIMGQYKEIIKMYNL